MKIEVNISKTYFFIILGVILLLAGAVYVYASVDQTKAWHDASQIDVGGGETLDNLKNHIAAQIQEVNNSLKEVREFYPGDIIIATDASEEFGAYSGWTKMKEIMIHTGGSVTARYMHGGSLGDRIAGSKIEIYRPSIDQVVSSPGQYYGEAGIYEEFEWTLIDLEAGDIIQLWGKGSISGSCQPRVKDFTLSVGNKLPTAIPL